MSSFNSQQGKRETSGSIQKSFNKESIKINISKSYLSGPRNTKSRNRDGSDSEISNIYSEFIRKAKEVTSRKSFSGFEEIVKLNELIRDLEKENEENLLAQNLYMKLVKKVRKIEEGIFNWAIDMSHLAEVQSVFGVANVFSDLNHFYLLNHEFFYKLMPFSYFKAFFDVPYTSYSKLDVEYQGIICFQSELFRTFKILFLQFPMAGYPKLDPLDISLIDPFMRHNFRTRNQKFFEEKVEKRHGFVLIKLINHIIDKFLLTGSSTWVLENSEPLFIRLLEIVVEGFAYGLFQKHNCDHFSTVIFMICDFISSLELECKNDKNSAPEKMRKYYNEFIKARSLVSKIVIQIITLYLDTDLVNSIRLSGPTNINFNTVFSDFILENKQVFTNVSLIYLKYLAQKLIFPEITHISEELEHLMHIILFFLTSYKKDFFSKSFSFMNLSYVESYFSYVPKENVADLARIEEEMGWMVNRIKSSHTLTADTKDLMQHLSGICHQVLKVFDQSEKPLHASLELTKLNFPSFLLQLLDFCDFNNESDKSFLNCIETLTRMFKNNYPAQSILFRDTTFHFYDSMFSKHNFLMMNMILDVFAKDNHMFKYSNRVFLMQIGIYRNLILTFKRLRNINENDQKLCLILGALRIFNLFFEDMLSFTLASKKNPKRYDLILSIELVNFIVEDVVPSFFNNKFLEDYDGVDLGNLNKKHVYIGQFNDQKEELQKTPLKKLIFEVFFSFLHLFNKATSSVYPGNVFVKIHDCISFQRVANMNYSYPSSILVRTEMLVLFDNFFIFYKNSLLYDRNVFIVDNKIDIDETFLPENANQIFSHLKGEFQWFDSFVEKEQNITKENHKFIEHYLLKGLLKAIYGFLSGVLNFITIIEKKETIDDLQKLCLELKGLFNDHEMYFSDLIGKKWSSEDLSIDSQVGSFVAGSQGKRNSDSSKNESSYKCLDKTMNGNEETDRIISMLKLREGSLTQKSAMFSRQRKNSKIHVLDFLELQHHQPKNSKPKNKNPRKSSKIEYPVDIIEERVYPNIMRLREYLLSCVNRIGTVYANANKMDLIKGKFDRSFVKKEFKILNEREKEKIIQEIISRSSPDDANGVSLISKLKKIYKEKKQICYFNLERNVFIKLLTVDQDSTDYNYYLAHNCLHYLSNIDMNFDNPVYERNFYINENYLSYMVAFTNLLHLSNQLRLEFLQVIRGKDKKKKFSIYKTTVKEFQKNQNLSFFKISLKILFELLLFVYYKAYMDRDWRVYWKQYQKVCRFLTAFYENNFLDFKEFLSQETTEILKPNGAEDKQMTIFEEHYFAMKVLIQKSRLSKNRAYYIVPSDRPELFPIIIRMIQNVNELISGGCLTNQLKLYTLDTELWMGIMERIIDDVNSSFYDLKYAVIIYISTFIESLDPKILCYFANCLKIQQLFDMMILLVKKLYLHTFLKTNSHEAKWEIQNFLDDNPQKTQYSKNNIFEVKNKKNWSIVSPSKILDIYKVDKKFSDHVLINTIVQTYILVTNMASQISFWNLYQQEKEKMARKWNYAPPQDREKAAVLNFIISIISHIEIRYKTGAEKSMEIKLRRFYFKAPPICFFLTRFVKNSFLSKMPIESPTSKQLYLYSNVKLLERQALDQQQQIINMNFLAYSITPEAFFLYKILLIIMNMALNGFMLYCFENPARKKGMDCNSAVSKFAILVCSILLIGLSGLMFASWCIFNLRPPLDEFFRKTRLGLKSKTKITRFLKEIVFKFVISNPEVNSFLIHIVLTTLGLLVNPVFYTLSTFAAVNVSKPLFYILKSITNNYEKLLVTFILMALVIYIYSFILLQYFTSYIAGEIGGPANCRSLLGCFMNSFNSGFRPGGGIGDMIEVVSNPHHRNFWGILFFDITYLILVKLILLNIIAGIIIETFGELRDEATLRSNNLSNVCIICGLDRWEIEKREMKFEDHVNNTHDVWKYFFYLLKLSETNKSSLVGVELQVWNLYVNSKTDWFPKKETLDRRENHRLVSDVEKTQDLSSAQEILDYHLS